jgi:hypothetical protein
MLQENRYFYFLETFNAFSRFDYDVPFSSHLSADLLGSDSPLVIRHQPHLVVQSSNPVPEIASKFEVNETM